MTVKIGKHQLRVVADAPKPGTEFSITPVEGATFVPGHGWRIPPKSSWQRMSSDDKSELIWASISALALLVDMPVAKEGMKEGFRNLVTNVKQSGVGRLGSQVYQFVKPGVQNVKNAVSEGYNTLKEYLSRLVGSKGTGEIEGRILLENWHEGTFPNQVKSLEYHLLKHGNGRSAVQYTNDAMNFYNKNKHLGIDVILKSGTKGIKIQTKQIIDGKIIRIGGYWTQDGKIVTFWD